MHGVQTAGTKLRLCWQNSSTSPSGTRSEDSRADGYLLRAFSNLFRKQRFRY
jgi:hypothetical protein